MGKNFEVWVKTHVIQFQNKLTCTFFYCIV